jgi:hypothetical protein
LFTDQQIVDAAYAGPKVPAGSYEENLNGDSLYYVNTVSVGASSNSWVELCSNDEAQAPGWAADTNANSSWVRSLDSSSQNEKFFEFRYVGQYDAVRMRVHKCTYAQPSFDRLQGVPGVWGSYNGSLIKNGPREFVEYDWFVRHAGRYDGSLLATVDSSNKSDSVFELYHAYVANAAGPGACDDIALAKTTVTIDRSRTVTMSTSVIRNVEGTCYP